MYFVSSIWFWIGQYDQFHTIIDKFYLVFKEFCCLWVLSPRIWNVLWMHLWEMNLLQQLKKWRDDPEIPKELFFCFIFGMKIHMWLSFKSHFKHVVLKDEVSRRFRCNILWEDVMVRIRSNYLFFFFFDFSM